MLAPAGTCRPNGRHRRTGHEKQEYTPCKEPEPKFRQHTKILALALNTLQIAEMSGVKSKMEKCHLDVVRKCITACCKSTSRRASLKNTLTGSAWHDCDALADLGSQTLLRLQYLPAVALGRNFVRVGSFWCISWLLLRHPEANVLPCRRHF